MMDLTRPLAVITPTVDGDVLAALALVAAAFTPPQLHRIISRHSEAGIRNSLQRLAGQGIVTVERVGNAYQYRLNRNHLAAEHIIALAHLPLTLRTRIEGELAGWAPMPVYAAVFGSAARGAMTSDSDIDLFLVLPDELTNAQTNAWESQVAALESQVTGWTGNDTRVLDFSEAQTRSNAQTEPVLADIVAHGLTVAGSTTWLRDLLNQRPTRRPTSPKEAAHGTH